MKELSIVPAWELVLKASLIKKFNFFPAFLSTLYLTLIVFWQIGYTYVYIFEQKDQAIALLLEVIHQSYFWQAAGVLIFIFLLYVFVVPLARGGLLSLIEGFLEKDRKKYQMGYGISQSLLHFLPIFEYQNFMAIFRLLSIVTFYISCLRILGFGYFGLITTSVLTYLLCAIIINILFSYTRFFIIFEKKPLFTAISLSTHMALKNIGLTVRLYAMLYLLYFRTLFTVLILLAFPATTSAIFAFFPSPIVQQVLLWCVIGII